MIPRPFRLFLGVSALGLMAIVLIRHRLAGTFEEPLRLVTAERVEGAPLCPWREPAAAVGILFPEAQSTFRDETEVRILSGLRPELARRLGRPPTAEENALQIHRIHAGPQHLGDVLVRRVKGAHGAIELVLAVTADHRVRGFVLQRQREPEEIAAALLDPGWAARFRGRNAAGLGTDELLGGLPEAARASAVAIRDGVFALLVLHELAASGRSTANPAGLATNLPPAGGHPH